eukprot:TRINITY_DN4330_c0_g1_i1.p1 TRINITY_DN4330_c0_g1~~TRINITY_DN4330_c0_g1_i1.p1  ORF type:complete len:281 (+),score=24.04 TRINITY_DN4330_c0_g1_i1:107-949(+)
MTVHGILAHSAASLSSSPLAALSAAFLCLLCARKFRDVILFFLFATVCMNVLGPISALIGWSLFMLTRDRTWLHSGFYWWLNGMQHFLGVRWRQHPASVSLIEGPCIYLMNHRSWADFFLDAYIVGGHASYLSRIGVLLVCPPMGFCAWLCDRIIFFRRGRATRVGLAEHIAQAESRWSPRHQRLLCYPEGHRNHGKAPLELRDGGLDLIYQKKIVCQIVITTNKEHVVSERFLSVHRGVTCTVLRAPSMDPATYASAAEWKAGVRTLFAETWQKAYELA